MDVSTHQIGGVTLEQYAKLAALMVNTQPEETDKHAEIAAANGVSNEKWEEAKKGWTEVMSSPEQAMAAQQIFMPAYQKALEEVSGGTEPCSLEDYARIKSAMVYEKEPENPEQKIDFQKVLDREGYTITQWGVIESYWNSRVNQDEHGRLQEGKFDEVAATKFRAFIQKHSDEYAGITRD